MCWIEIINTKKKNNVCILKQIFHRTQNGSEILYAVLRYGGGGIKLFFPQEQDFS